jgi:hypothetical protein
MAVPAAQRCAGAGERQRRDKGDGRQRSPACGHGCAREAVSIDCGSPRAFGRRGGAACIRLRRRDRRTAGTRRHKDVGRAVAHSRKQILLVDRHTSYAHNDPNTAAPKRNVFLKQLVPFLKRIAKR